MDAEAFWEDFYAGDRHRWSGRPNELLVAAVADVSPGTALDLGCGEGADAIWLAQRGWQVTAVDISSAALAVAAELATAAGATISWARHDLEATFPAGTFDLVASAYLQSPVALGRAAILRRATAAVRPGGLLVVIGHAGPPSWASPGHGTDHPSAAEVLAALDLGGGWRVERCADVVRDVRDPDGDPGTQPDSVIRARRLGP